MIKNKIYNCSNIGKLMMLTGFFLLMPVIFLPFYKDEHKYIYSFLIPSFFSIILGFIFCVLYKKENNITNNWYQNLGKTSLIVLFAWFYGILMGCLPFILANKLNFVQAIFESVSGWTTTGLSVIDVSKTPKIFLFHRSFMQYCGGLGFIMLMIVIISNKNSMSLYNAEGHPDKIMPNIKKTAQIIFKIYTLSLFIGTVAYKTTGMSWFDSICHSMCSLSTGGFSTKLKSIGEYNNLKIEFITIILMLIGTTNFAALILLAKGKFKNFFNISEIKFMFALLAIFIPLTAFSLSSGLSINIFEGFRKSAFDVISALSTTGYSTMSYANWPQFSIGILILMMIIGGGIGSTAGGIKLSRVYLILKFTFLNIKKKFLPPTSVNVQYYIKGKDKTLIDKELIDDVLSFAMLYIIFFIVGTLLITLTENCTLIEAMFDFSSSIGTVGLSIGITNPSTNCYTLIIEIIGMILGRLEIFIVLIGFTFGLKEIKYYTFKNIKNLLKRS